MSKGYVYFYYNENNDVTKELKFRRLPYRATKSMVIGMIDKIKDDIGYKAIKAERAKKIKNDLKEKDLIFANVR